MRPLTQKWEADSSCVSCMMATCAPRAATRRTPHAFASCFALDSRASAVSRVPHLFPQMLTKQNALTLTH